MTPDTFLEILAKVLCNSPFRPGETFAIFFGGILTSLWIIKVGISLIITGKYHLLKRLLLRGGICFICVIIGFLVPFKYLSYLIIGGGAIQLFLVELDESKIWKLRKQ